MRKLSLIIGTVLALGTAQQASAALYYAPMSGLNEVPANASTATGLTTLTLTGNNLTVDIQFSGLIGGNATAAHIHCCTAPGSTTSVVLPFTGFPAATSGSYLVTFDLSQASTYTAAFVTANGGTAAGAEAALIAGLDAGLAYSNIHNGVYPGGEIRGFIRAPEPLTLSIFGAGLVGAAALRRRAKKAA